MSSEANLTKVADEDVPLDRDSQIEAQNQRAIDDENRKNFTQKHLNKITIGAFWLLALSAAIMFLSLIWHFVTPLRLQFLTIDQLNNLKQMLFSGGAGAAIAQLSKKHLS
jgi:hypothetical protein